MTFVDGPLADAARLIPILGNATADGYDSVVLPTPYRHTTRAPEGVAVERDESFVPLRAPWRDLFDLWVEFRAPDGDAVLRQVVFDSTEFVADGELTHATSRWRARSSLNAGLLVLDVNVTIAFPARVVSVSGTAALIADAPLRLTKMYGGTTVFADATVDGFFNPTRLVLDGGPLSLTRRPSSTPTERPSPSPGVARRSCSSTSGTTRATRSTAPRPTRSTSTSRAWWSATAALARRTGTSSRTTSSSRTR